MRPKPTNRKGRANLQRILRASRAYIEAQVLFAGASLDVFGAIHGGARSAAAVARACGPDPRATEMLLDALVALRFLKK